MKRVSKMLAGAAIVVAACLGSIAPANAVYGNTVTNRSIGLVSVQLDNGLIAHLYGYGATAHNVKYLLVDMNQCISMSTHMYCGPYGPYKVLLPLAQITVVRVS
jgi:hypothetical protein